MKAGREFETGLAEQAELDPIRPIDEHGVRIIAQFYRSNLIASKDAGEEILSRAQRGLDRRENGYLNVSADIHRQAAADLKTVLNLLGQSRLAQTIKQQVDLRSR